jgi:transcriptional regulator with XRE-family HTH domain
VEPDYSGALGASLRRIRTQKGMSLQDVQEASRGRWKAAVVGAYERGDRNVTVARLAKLAEFYGVPPARLLPPSGEDRPRADTRRRIVLDLESFHRIPEAERSAAERFASAIQLQRSDFNGRVLTVREGDLLALALLYEVSPEEMGSKLASWGVLLESDS